MRKILATDFSIWPMAEHPNPPVSDVILHSPEHWESLANYLLLYDQIIIPTGNFQIIPTLRMMFGEDVFDELVLQKVITFVRYNHWICYGGNGRGLAVFQVSEGEKDKDNRLRRLGLGFFKEIDEAISIMLNVSNPDFIKKGRKFITNLLIDSTSNIDLKSISNDLKNDTYRDIRDSKYLFNLFSPKKRNFDLDKLPGINDNQIRMLALHSEDKGEIISPEITFLLKVAIENFILGIGSFVNATDIVSDNETFNVIKAKGQRFGCTIGGRDAFAKIQDISGVPDLGKAFADNSLKSKELLDLRNTASSTSFRNWIGSIDSRASSKEIVERYIESISSVKKHDQFGSKLIRFVITKIWEGIEPISGNVASIAEAFFLNKLYPNKCPDLFMKKAKTIVCKPNVKEPISNRISRKSSCPCRSGKKYKRCCGKI
jgi:hypothetical protein